MSRVDVCTSSAFLALVIQKTLTRSRHLEPTEHRDAAGAVAALRGTTHLAVVDAELLRDGSDGAALHSELATRGAASIVLDVRGRGVPGDIAAAASIIVVRGGLRGELDLGVIEAELLPAVARALRHRDASDAAAWTSAPAVERPGAYDGILELVVLGVSTGGPALLLELLEALVEPAIPMLIVQHMPETETTGLAARLTEVSGLAVREVGGGPLLPIGAIGLLSGGRDFRIARRGRAIQLVETTIAGNPFHPNIDLVLTSAVDAGLAVGAAILTGMGRDGAAGATAMAQKGLPVIAQRPDTCAVAGMPQAVIDSGAARWVQSPERIASTVNAWSEAARREAGGGGSKCLP